MKKAYLFILLGLALYSNAKSQADFRPGYIVTLENDTVNGFIDFRDNDFNAYNCFFKKDLNSEEIQYLPLQIKSYTINNFKYYQSRNVFTKDSVEKAVFLENIVKGKLNVFYFGDKKLPGFFVEKEEDTLIFLYETKGIEYDSLLYDWYVEHKEYRGPLTYYLRDYPNVSQRISSVELTQKSMIRLAVDYQKFACPNEECTIYNKASKVIVYGGIFGGYRYDMVELFNVGKTYDYDSKVNGFTTGITLDFMKPNQFKSLFGSFSLGYFRAEHEGKFDVTTFNHPTFHMQYNGLSLSYGAYYCYRHFKLQPYTGLALVGSLTHKSKTIYDDMDIYYTNLSKLIFTCGITAGLIYNFNDSFCTKLLVEYQPKLQEGSQDSYYKTRTRALNAVMAILYHF